MWFTSLVVDGYFKFVRKNAHAHCASHGCVELTHIHVSTTCTHACVSTPHRCTRVSPTTGSCGTNPPTKTLLGACFSWEGSSRHITSLLNQRSSDIASAHHHRSLTCMTRPCVTSNQSSGKVACNVPPMLGLAYRHHAHRTCFVYTTHPCLLARSQHVTSHPFQIARLHTCLQQCGLPRHITPVQVHRRAGEEHVHPLDNLAHEPGMVAPRHSQFGCLLYVRNAAQSHAQ